MLVSIYLDWFRLDALRSPWFMMEQVRQNRMNRSLRETSFPQASFVLECIVVAWMITCNEMQFAVIECN